jgi:vanillate O-demethylase ferredoxin subunit
MSEGRRLTVRVANKTDLVPGSCLLELVHPQGEPLPPFAAGAHIDVALPGGHVRQYSLCNAPAERHRYLLGILDQPGGRGGSRAIHEQVHAGSLLDISEPRCHFALDDGATDSILLAGGIGITPLLAMAEHLAARRRAFSLDYFVRSAAAAAFRERIACAPWSDRARMHADDEGGGDLGAVIGMPRDGKHLYVCGPTGFLDAALDTARRLGWPEDHLHREYFSNGDANVSGGAFDVRIASSGKTIRVASAQSIAAALAAENIVVPTSCEQGVCGTCITRVLAGTPDHRDVFLTDEERAANDCVAVCCSRAATPLLVLDL